MPKSHPSNEPLLFALVNGLCEVGVVVHDGSICALGGLRSLRLVGVVGSFVAEHVPNEEDQGAEDGEDHHSNDAWWRQDRRQVQRILHFPQFSPLTMVPSDTIISHKKTQNQLQTLTGLKGELDQVTITLGDFHTLLSVIDSPIKEKNQ